MKILVAGGAGYIGSALVPALLERGYGVDVVDLLWFGNNLPKEVNVEQRDVMTLEEDDVEGYDQVVDLAGLSNDPMAEFSPAKNFIYNAAAPAYMAYLAKNVGVKRYIYAGSCSVYGYNENELYDETSPPESNFPYGISKLQGERAVLQMVDETFSVIALRQGTVCGYSPRMRLDLVVNTMFKTAVRDNTITINNPAIWRPILCIKDATSAYIRAIEADHNISGLFNIASGNYTVGEIADLVKTAVEKYLGLPVKFIIKHLEDFRSYKVDIEKARNVLSFKPRSDIDTIVKDLADSMDRFKDVDNILYYNIETFKELETQVRRER